MSSGHPFSTDRSGAERHSPTSICPVWKMALEAESGTTDDTCSKKVTASGFLHLLLQFRRGVLAALCYISAAKWKYTNSGFTNKAFGMALSARYSPRRIKNFFANSAAAFFLKSPLLPTTPGKAKWTEIFGFFSFSLSFPTSQKNHFLPKTLLSFSNSLHGSILILPTHSSLFAG